MTSAASTDAKNLVAEPTPAMPHERDESADGKDSSDRPELQKAFDAVKKGPDDTVSGEATGDASTAK